MIDIAGYIKLYRGLQENPIWQEKPFSKGQAWVDIVFRCNHVCKKVIGYGDIKWVLRGQFISSNYKLAEAWGWSESSVRKFIKLLKSESMVMTSARSKNTLYEVTKYCAYQSLEESELQPFVNAQKTHRKRTAHAQKTPNNNDNNYKELKEVINIYAIDPKLKEAFLNFLNMRVNKKKVPTLNAMELIVGKLNKYDIESQIMMLNKSTINNWTDVYALKEDHPKETKSSNVFADIAKERGLM